MLLSAHCSWQTSENSGYANFAELVKGEVQLPRIPIPRTPVNKGKYGPGGGNASRTARKCSGPFFVRALWAVPTPEQSRRRAYASTTAERQGLRGADPHPISGCHLNARVVWGAEAKV